MLLSTKCGSDAMDKDEIDVGSAESEVVAVAAPSRLSAARRAKSVFESPKMQGMFGIAEEEEESPELRNLKCHKEEQKQKLRLTWTPLRYHCAELAESKRCEVFINACVGLNFVLMVIETDQNADCVGRLEDGRP